MPPFTACVVQTPSYPYDKAGNLQRALDTMETAAAQGASLILFPEMFLTGYLIRNKLEELSESLEDGPALAALSAKAKALSMGVLMGLPLKNPTGKPYNAIVMIDRDGTIAGVQAKTHFFGGEEKMFSTGEALQAFDTSFGRMGILVCYDGEFPETARSLALDGAKMICMCAANMTPYEDYHFVYMRTRAMENRIYTLYCNYVGNEKRFHYCGQSGIFHPTGRILAEADQETPGLLYAPIDLADTTAEDDYLNYLRHRPAGLNFGEVALFKPIFPWYTQANSSHTRGATPYEQCDPHRHARLRQIDPRRLTRQEPGHDVFRHGPGHPGPRARPALPAHPHPR